MEANCILCLTPDRMRSSGMLRSILALLIVVVSCTSNKDHLVDTEISTQETNELEMKLIGDWNLLRIEHCTVSNSERADEFNSGKNYKFQIFADSIQVRFDKNGELIFEDQIVGKWNIVSNFVVFHQTNTKSSFPMPYRVHYAVSRSKLDILKLSNYYHIENQPVLKLTYVLKLVK
jgi:hypothetical protein